MTSNLILRPKTELSSEVFTKKTSLIARGLNEISLLKPSPESLYQTGMDYYEGSNGKPWDILKAYAYLVKSAEQDFVLAQWRLACMFMGDEAVEKNVDKNECWQNKAALNGHLGAMHELLDKSSETYSQELTHLAENGCKEALSALVRHCIRGNHKCIKQDMGQAWYWVKRGVEQLGSYGDLLTLAFVTADFWDEVDRDSGYWLERLSSKMYSATERTQYSEKRMIWLREKAQQGEAFAQYRLGVELSEILEEVNGVEKTYLVGDKTFLVGGDHGQLVVWEQVFHQQAVMATGEPIDWEKLVIFWLTKAAEQGFWAAQQSLAEEYANGKLGVEIDYKNALYWYRKAAEQEFDPNYFKTTLAFNETDIADAPKFTFEELEHYRLNNQDSI